MDVQIKRSKINLPSRKNMASEPGVPVNWYQELEWKYSKNIKELIYQL